MAKDVLSDSIKANIDNYGNQIETLKDFVTAVRKLPGMYITAIGNRGFKNMQRETFQNGVDQVNNPNSPADHIIFYYNEKTLETIVEDNGMGIPFDRMEAVLTAHHTSSNYTKRKGEYTSGRHGSGLKAVNGLSSHCYIESYHYSGKAMRLETVEGYAKKKPFKIPNKEKKQGCKISFIPCLDVLGELTLSWKSSYLMVKQIIALTPIGSKVTFIADDINGVRHQEEIVNMDGIITELIERVKSPIIKPIIFSHDTGEMKLECAFCYDSGADDGGPDSVENVSSFCNMTPTGDGGTHVDGTIDGICRWFNNYMNKIYLAGQKSKEKIKVTNADIKSGLNVVISAFHLLPNFGGQAKDSVTNAELNPFCKEVIMKGLDEWSRNNPQDLSKLCRYFKDLAEIRQKSESSKVKIAAKYNANPLSGLPSKYCKPLEVKDELFIVEGDSAGGSAKTARNKKTQGIFPIRGKIINIFQHSRKKVMANAEVQGFIHILLNQRDYFRNFDPYKDVEWNKIIILADADVDGDHIAALMIRLFVILFPQLIEAGKLYKAIPPLYAITKGKKNVYFTEQLDITRYIQKFFAQKYSLAHMDGTPLTSKEYTTLFMNNADLEYEISNNAFNYAVPPEMLEVALMHQIHGGNMTSLKKTITSMYRFMNVEKSNGILKLTGTTDKKNLLYLSDQLFNDCHTAMDIIKANKEHQFLMNGEPASLYTIMKTFDNCNPSEVQRYKGLGEMDADELWESTMNPETRTLIQYTMEDAKEEIELIREYETDTKKLLDLVGMVSRSDLAD